MKTNHSHDLLLMAKAIDPTHGPLVKLSESVVNELASVKEELAGMKEATAKLLVFTKELCEDINVSQHYPSIENAERALNRSKL